MGMDDTRTRLGTKLYTDFASFSGTGTNQELIATPGVGFKIIVDRIIMYPKSAAAGIITFKESNGAVHNQIFPQWDFDGHDGIDDSHIVLPENRALRASWTNASGVEFYIVYSIVDKSDSRAG